MADIKLKVLGENHSKGTTDEAAAGLRSLEQVSEDVQHKMASSIGLSTAAWGELLEGIKKAAEMLVDFTKESVKLYAEQERMDKQLEMATGSLSEAFKRQAEAIEESIGFDSVKTEKMQMLLYQFGVAPAEIDKTVKALLDYSARMGTDALQATEGLLTSVNSGKQGFKELGIHIESTGEKAKDVGLYVDALSKKLGGSAEADAGTLSGSTRVLTAHWENLQKAFGGWIAKVESSWGVVSKLTGVMDTLAAGVKNAGVAWRMFNAESLADATKIAAEAGVERTVDEGTKPEVELPKVNSNNGLTNKGAQQAAESAKKWDQAIEKSAGDAAAAVVKAWKEARKQQEKDTEEFGKHFVGTWEKAVKQSDEDTQKLGDSMVAVMHDLNDEAERTRVQWEDATKAIGASIVTNIAGAIQSMMEGGKFDAKKMMGTILQSIMAIVGNVLLPGIGGQIGGALGGIFSAGIGKMHDGGWVGGIPRHHDGTMSQDEHLAILQQGERVLSRAEVASMGGPGGVDGRASGNAVNVSVQTIDAESSRSYFERRGGRAIFNAVRTGRGQLRPLFGM